MNARIATVAAVIRKSRPKSPVFFIMNRQRKTAETLSQVAFPSREYVQSAFAWGFMMSDGHSANAWGSCCDMQTFLARAKHLQFTVL